MTDRILVTGSRNWDDYIAMKAALDYWVGDDDVLVHGDCPTGLDAMAKAYAIDCGIQQEAHPADWSLGRKAGPLRNQQMVDLGAFVCLAFPLGDSRGTRDCMRRARLAGINTVVFGDQS